MPKITDLTSETTPAANDVLAIVDVASGTTKKITREDLIAGSPLPADSVTTAAIDDGAVTAAKIDFDSGISGEVMGETVLGSANDTITVSSLPLRKHFRIVASLLNTGTVNVLLRFNGDSGNNYAVRFSANGAADTTSASDNSLVVSGATAQTGLLVADVVNIAAQEKLVSFQFAGRNAAGAANLPNRSEGAGKWANTSNAITSVSIVNTNTGDFAAGSSIKVIAA